MPNGEFCQATWLFLELCGVAVSRELRIAAEGSGHALTAGFQLSSFCEIYQRGTCYHFTRLNREIDFILYNIISYQIRWIG